MFLNCDNLLDVEPASTGISELYLKKKQQKIVRKINNFRTRN